MSEEDRKLLNHMGVSSEGSVRERVQASGKYRKGIDLAPVCYAPLFAAALDTRSSSAMDAFQV